MSTVLQNSPALKVASIAVGIVVVVALYSAFSGDEKPAQTNGQSVQHQQVTKPVEADPDAADTAAQDRARLSAQMQEILLKVKALESDKSNQVNPQEGVSTSDITKLVEQKLAELNGNTPPSPSKPSTSMTVAQSTDDALSDYVVSGDTPLNKNQPASEQINFDAPVESEQTVGLSGFSVGAFSNDNEVQWVMPADAKEGGFIDGFMKETDKLNFAESKEEKKKKQFVQYATIDKEAILYDAVVLTELVGVTPYSGQVTSPYYFKIELGRENLMTSGINLPQIAQMRMSGYAVGEWTTSCVQGIVTSATFVFEDGTIASAGATQSEAQGSGIGYLTDPYGSPCIKGEKYSDLAEYVAVAGGLGAVSAIGDGISNAQFDMTQTATGLQQAFTGSSMQLALGEGLSGSTSAASEIIAKRYESTRDLVIAPPGQYVVVQLTQQLDINYDPEGRKILNHDFEQDLAEYYEQKAISGE